MRSSAQVVVIGAGVVGASAAYHLTELGWTDVVVVDKGPRPATGGSSSHAPGLEFQTNPSRTTIGFVTSAAHGYSVGESLAYAWVPAEYAAEGTSVELTYLDERYPARVASEPRFDPTMTRMRR